jgi:penicillin amidase
MAFRHPLDDQGDRLGFLDPPPVERPGDADTVQATGYENNTFEQAHGASYREILDPGDWDRSLAINVPGQSGQPGARHYDDLLPLWSAGEYFPLVFSRAAVDRATTDVLRLEP